MNRSTALISYVVLMIAIIVTVDIIFFRHRFGQRLIANIAIVLVFIVLYLIFLRSK